MFNGETKTIHNKTAQSENDCNEFGVNEQINRMP